MRGEEMEECPGQGACHGCVVWCDRCGDVGDVCSASRCDVHRCQECNEIRRPQDRDHWTYVCEVCEAPDPIAMLAMYREAALCLAANLRIAAGLCAAFQLGFIDGADWVSATGREQIAPSAPWRPGCGRSCP
jgi:hypothetical protein